jgi:hypothetical protein
MPKSRNSQTVCQWKFVLRNGVCCVDICGHVEINYRSCQTELTLKYNVNLKVQHYYSRCVVNLIAINKFTAD